jgi:hypothetical protein
VDKSAYQAKLSAEGECHDDHCEIVERYEDQLNGKVPKVQRRLVGGLDGPEVEAPGVQIMAVSGSSLEARKFLGVFWPLTVFCAREGRKPAKVEVTEIQHCGELIKGVLRSETFGRPVGTIDLHQTSFSGVEKNLTLHESKKAIHDDEGEEVMKHAHQRMTVGVTTKEVGKEGAKAEVVRLSCFSLAKKVTPQQGGRRLGRSVG